MNWFQTLLYGPYARPTETFSAETETVTDLGVAFARAIEAQEAGPDVGVPAAYRGAQFIGDTAGRLEMAARDRSTGLVSAEQPELLSRPNPNELYRHTIGDIVTSLIFDGNAFILPVTRSTTGDVTSVHIADPSTVNVDWNSTKTARLYSWGDRDLEHGRDIVHISMLRLPGRTRGLGPFTAARLALETAKASDRYAARLFSDDATPPLAIKIPQVLSAVEAQGILDQWEDTHKNRKRPAVLGGGATIEQLALNPVDAQFLESRRFDVQQVARVLGIPGPLLSVSTGDSLTYTTTESLFRQFNTATLEPSYLDGIAAAFSLLIPSHQKARFETSELFTADLTSRYAAYKTGIDGGFLTAAEVRRWEGLGPVGAA